MKKILMVLSAADHWTLADGTRQPAGFWAEEAVGPYQEFTAAGYEVVAATPGGVPPTVDPISLMPEYAGGAEHAEALRAALAEANALANPLRLDSVDLAEFDAVFYPGGWGPMEDLSTEPVSGRLLVEALAAGKVVALVCHGPAALLSTIDETGASPFAGYRITSMSNEEEKIGGMADRAKWLLQDRLTQDLGIDYRAGVAYEPHIEVDRNVLTGQNPASAIPLAKGMLAALANGDRS